MNQETTRPEADLTLLTVWLRWYGWVIFTVGVFFVVIFAMRGSPASLIFAVFLTLIVFPSIRYGLRVAENGRPAPALIVSSVSLWVIALVVSARGLTALPAGLPMAIIPVILALPYVSRVELLKIAAVTVAVSTAAYVIAASGPWMPSSLSELTLKLIVGPIVAVASTMTLLGLWHVGSRLRSSVVALVKSERSLEHKVEKRTAELEHALGEISAIQQIVGTANATLDPDKVMETVLSAISSLVPFNQAGFMLLDENRQQLANLQPIGPGVSSEILEQLTGLVIPMSDEESAIIRVVKDQRPFFLSRITPEVVAMMSESGRRLFEMNPVKSVLFCPIKIEKECLGIFYFANTFQVLDLEQADIDRIERHVTHLSTAIRNARLHHETQQLNRDLAAAEKRIGDLVDSASGGVEDVGGWASEVAMEVAEAIGVPEITVWLLEREELSCLTGGKTTGELTVEDMETLSRSGKSIIGDTDIIVPVMGISGELYGALMVPGDATTLGEGSERVINGFARHLGSALELKRMRQDLAEAAERRRATRQEMLERGIDLLQVCPKCDRCYDQESEVCEDDGTKLEAPQAFPYRVAGRYRLERRVGEGGMGTVFHAHDERLEREVAVKVIKSEHFDNDAVRQRFQREARTVARIDHPGVVAVFDSGELEERSLYIVMEWLRGWNLGQILKLQGPGTPQQVAAFSRQAGAALDAAHRQKLVHRDIKPENLFLTSEPDGFRVKIVDFGVAKELVRDSQITQTGTVIGTPLYMSPEQLNGEAVESRSDIYSLAVVIFEALTGKRLVKARAFAKVLMEVSQDEPPKVSDYLEQAPPELDELFAEALAKEPGGRPRSAQDWAEKLGDLMESLDISREGWRVEAWESQPDSPGTTNGTVGATKRLRPEKEKKTGSS